MKNICSLECHSPPHFSDWNKGSLILIILSFSLFSDYLHYWTASELQFNSSHYKVTAQSSFSELWEIPCAILCASVNILTLQHTAERCWHWILQADVPVQAMCYLPLSRSPASQTWFYFSTEQCAVTLCEEPFPGTGHSTKPSGRWNIPREHNKGGMSATGTISVTISHRAVMWFISPQGSPSGVSTGHRKPQDSGSSLRTVVVLIWENAAPLWMQRKWER